MTYIEECQKIKGDEKMKKKLCLLIILSVLFSAISFSFSVGGFIKGTVQDKAEEMIGKQLYKASKPVFKYDSSSKKVALVSGTIKNLGPKTGMIGVSIACYDSAGGTMGRFGETTSYIDANGTWNYSITVVSKSELAIGKCDLGQMKITGF